jgi:hypothetical protein
MGRRHEEGWGFVLDAMEGGFRQRAGDKPEEFSRQPKYSQRKPSPQRLRYPTDGDGKCMVQNSVSVSQ